MKWTYLGLGLLLSAATLSCSDSDDTSGSGSGGSPGHGHEEGACGEINAVCHPADDGSNDLATECHHIAHENQTQACELRREECLSFCNEKLGHGHGGAGGDHGHDH